MKGLARRYEVESAGRRVYASGGRVASIRSIPKWRPAAICIAAGIWYSARPRGVVLRLYLGAYSRPAHTRTSAAGAIFAGCRCCGPGSPATVCQMDTGVIDAVYRYRNIPEKEDFVVKLRLREHESISDAVKRFRKLVEHAGIKKEMRRREYYEKPSDQRRRARRRAERRARLLRLPPGT
jgi:small subunit ribosomal protein S21